MTPTLARLRVAAGMVALVLVAGTIGYLVLGLSLIDAMYQTVTTVSTVGFREVREFDTAQKIFTIALITVGVGTVLYTFTLGVQMIVDGQLREIVGRRRMDRIISDLRGHVVVCGWGRVGRAVAADLERDRPSRRRRRQRPDASRRRHDADDRGRRHPRHHVARRRHRAGARP